MAITFEEQKRRQSILEKEKQVISQLNDDSDLRERIRNDKNKNNEEVIQDNEGSHKKIARPDLDNSL